MSYLSIRFHCHCWKKDLRVHTQTRLQTIWQFLWSCFWFLSVMFVRLWLWFHFLPTSSALLLTHKIFIEECFWQCGPQLSKSAFAFNFNFILFFRTWILKFEWRWYGPLATLNKENKKVQTNKYFDENSTDYVDKRRKLFLIV